MNTFAGRIATVRDASSFDVEYDLGFDVKVTYTTRLLVPDSNEPLYTRNKAYGVVLAKQFVQEWLLYHPTLSVDVIERRNGVVYGYIRCNEESISQLLIDNGYQMSEPDKQEAKVSIYQREDVVPKGLYPFEYDPEGTIETYGEKKKFFPL